MTFFVDDMKMSQFSPLLEECVQFSRIRKICLNPWLKLLTKILRFSPSLSLYIERPVNTISNVFRWKKQQNRWGRRIEEFRQNKINLKMKKKWKRSKDNKATDAQRTSTSTQGGHFHWGNFERKSLLMYILSNTFCSVVLKV